MSALAAIISEYGLRKRKDPDLLGEILRAWAFVGEGLGCYSNFEVNAEAVQIKPTPREFAFLWGREFDPTDDDPNSWGYCDAEALKEIRWFQHPNGIEFGWHWDGDGCLAFYVPELSGTLRNSDCKKDRYWEFNRSNLRRGRA